MFDAAASHTEEQVKEVRNIVIRIKAPTNATIVGYEMGGGSNLSPGRPAPVAGFHARPDRCNPLVPGHPGTAPTGAAAHGTREGDRS